MTVKELLAQGQLYSALAYTEALVRKEPMNYRHRTTLFSLLCIAGELPRAEQQLCALGQENEEAAEGSATYAQVLAASRGRDAVLRGAAPGHFLLNEPVYAASQRQVIHCIAQNDLGGAEAALREVEQLRPACLVQVGDRVGAIRDADDRFAPVAELFVHGEYVWLPWEQVRSLRITGPVHLRDLLWAPVVIELDAGPLQAFMPVLYPVDGAADELTRLGRVTQWSDNEFGLSIGQGARLLALEPDIATSATDSAREAVHDLTLFEIGRFTRLGTAAPEVAEAAGFRVAHEGA